VHALPSSKLGNACAYTLGLWTKLTRFLDYPELELSNNSGGKLDAPGGAGEEELDPQYPFGYAAYGPGWRITAARPPLYTAT
jgi:hypothetical protein